VRAFLLVPVAAALIALATPAEAHACDSPLPAEYWLDESLVGVDVEPPTAVGIERVEVSRRRVPMADDTIPFFTCGSSSAKNGGVHIRILASEDDHADSNEIGYRAEVVGGKAPRGLVRDPLPAESRTIVVRFDDEDDDDVVDFRMRLIPVDTAGNEGPPSETFRVRDEGVGCSAAAGPATPLALLALVALLPRRRARARSRI
jgi:uncharacterized protein (TIGR03382 family)